MLHQFPVFLSDYQIKNLRREIKKMTPVIPIRFSHTALTSGVYPMLFTVEQIDRIKKAVDNGKGIIIKFSLDQFLEFSDGAEGGQLATIASVLLPILGSLATPLINKGVNYIFDKIKEGKAKKAQQGEGALFPYGVSPKRN